MERIFQAAALILAGVAIYFLWNGRSDSAFIAAVLGSVAFFLGIRTQVKRRNDKRTAEAVESENNDVSSIGE